LNLDFVCHDIMQKFKPLNWEKFWSRQFSTLNTSTASTNMTYSLPLRVIVSGLISNKSIALSAEKQNFQSLSELAECIKASMALPGITGDVIRFKGSQLERSSNLKKMFWKEHQNKHRFQRREIIYGSEPFSDALLFEPLPYRTALAPITAGGDNCTHAIVIRTRADNISVTLKMNMVEQMIMRRFFGRKLQLPSMMHYMLQQYHKLVYAQDILRLNAENRNFLPLDHPESAKLYGIALPPGLKEVSRTETSRPVIYANMKAGFAAAYDALVEDPKLRVSAVLYLW
jgi:hypothetical protein